MSKGSSPRPYSVPLKEFDNNFDRIFRKPDPREIEDAQIEDEAFRNILTQQDKEDKTHP